MATSIIYRNWTCTFCGYNRTSKESYRQFRKAYSAHYDNSEKHQKANAEFYANHPEYKNPKA